MKTKAQMNWEIGKEQEQEVLGILEQQCDKEFMDRIKGLFYQIRQNEYRRGKEDGQNELRQNRQEIKNE